MEVIFGIQARDGALHVNIPEDKVDALRKQLGEAFDGKGNSLLWVTDKDGREIALPTEKIAFVEFGADKVTRQVGFSSAN
jgi:hypothetical protein